MWRPVAGYEGIYEVRHSGEICRVEGKNSRGYYQPYKELRQTKNKSGHWYVSLHNGGQITKTVHRIVAEAFIPNPNNLPLVRHLDDNPDNNHVDNLAWGTKRDNQKDAVRNGRVRPKTHCVHGHERTKDNLTKGGACRMCNINRAAEWRSRNQLDTGEADLESGG